MQAMSYEEAIEANRFRHVPIATHDFLVFIGRFQPFHPGHRQVIVQALQQANHVVVLIGSASAPRWYRNPWTFDEREAMIRGAFSAAENERLIVRPIDDSYNDTLWVQSVQHIVEEIVDARHDFTTDPRIGLIGHNKDNTSYYLKLFPQWSAVNVLNYLDIAATRMRESMFSNICEVWLNGTPDLLLPNVKDFLTAFAKTPDYEHLLDEFAAVRETHIAWAKAPYPPTFITTDAVVIQAGHILLGERGEHPFQGKLALPGGHLDGNLSLLDNMIKELREETRIARPDRVVRKAAALFDPVVFDAPYRDPRGRYITHAFLVKLEPRNDDFKLPRVRGGTDVKAAHWFPLAEVKRQDMAFDHFEIIQKMIARL